MAYDIFTISTGSPQIFWTIQPVCSKNIQPVNCVEKMLLPSALLRLGFGYITKGIWVMQMFTWGLKTSQDLSMDHLKMMLSKKESPIPGCHFQVPCQLWEGRWNCYPKAPNLFVGERDSQYDREYSVAVLRKIFSGIYNDRVLFSSRMHVTYETFLAMTSNVSGKTYVLPANPREHSLGS